MQIANNTYLQKSVNKKQDQTNFKGTYIVQIPHKAFSNPEDMQNCSKVVAGQISKFIRRNKFLQKFNNFLNLFDYKLFCYPEKFSYMFSKKGMESCKLNNSIQWLRINTGLPIADALKENYHSFFIYTKGDARNVLKQILLACGNTSASEFFEKYTDPIMIAAAKTAKIGVELDKRMEKQYKNAPKYIIEQLADLKEIAQKIKKADSTGESF